MAGRCGSGLALSGHLLCVRASANPVLRYLAILSAARDFGVTQESMSNRSSGASTRSKVSPAASSPTPLADTLWREPRAAS